MGASAEDEKRIEILTVPLGCRGNVLLCSVLFWVSQGLMASCPRYCVAVVQMKGDKNMYYIGQIINSKDGINSYTCFIVREMSRISSKLQTELSNWGCVISASRYCATSSLKCFFQLPSVTCLFLSFCFYFLLFIHELKYWGSLHSFSVEFITSF